MAHGAGEIDGSARLASVLCVREKPFPNIHPRPPLSISTLQTVDKRSNISANVKSSKTRGIGIVKMRTMYNPSIKTDPVCNMSRVGYLFRMPICRQSGRPQLLVVISAIVGIGTTLSNSASPFARLRRFGGGVLM